MKKIQLLLLLCFPVLTISSQSNFMWGKRMGGTAGDAGWSISVDNAGNICTTGFFSGTVDFDPGSGTLDLTSYGNEDIFISKLDPSGNLLWAKQFGGTQGDRGFALVTDASGNVYATGAFVGTADFDPGPASFNMTSAAAYGDMFIVKLDAAGNFVWAKQFGGTGSISGYSIALDAIGNVHATGSFTGIIDFDPGAGNYNLTSTGSYDIFVCKTDPSGNLMWAKQMGGTAGYEVNISNAIAVDAAGNVYTTGASEYVTDFDPGAGYYPLDSAGLFLSKLDASGNFVWAKNIVSPNVMGNALTIDNSGNVIIAGSFAYTADFDMGTAVSDQTSSGGRNIFILKTDASGNFTWMKQMGSSTSGDYAYGVVTDASGNIYSTGSFSDVADLDPGPGTFNVTATGSDDIFISELDASGNFICAAQMGGAGTDYGYALDLDASGVVFVTGAFMGTADVDPGAGSYLISAAGDEDIFVSAASSCSFGVGVNELSENDGPVIFPNPTSGKIKLSGVSSTTQTELWNAQGERIQINVSNEIDLSALPGGMYFLKLNDGDKITTKKIIRN